MFIFFMFDLSHSTLKDGMDLIFHFDIKYLSAEKSGNQTHKCSNLTDTISKSATKCRKTWPFHCYHELPRKAWHSKTSGLHHIAWLQDIVTMNIIARVVFWSGSWLRPYQHYISYYRKYGLILDFIIDKYSTWALQSHTALRDKLHILISDSWTEQLVFHT